jgi:hypothetical protein
MPPFTIPGGNPVMEVPGETPRLPFTTLKPALVIVDPARAPKEPDVPRGTVEKG